MISNMTMGTPYMTRVSAMNSEGYGSSSNTNPISETPRRVPKAVQSVTAISLNKNLIKVTWSPPTDGIHSGGATIGKYKIEWDTAADYSNIGTSGYVHEFTDLSAGAGHGPFYFNIPVTINSNYYVS